jgi:predicted ArsR family transcriptional regulator
METRGRKPAFGTAKQIAEALESIQAETFKSRYLTLQLVKLGLVETYTEALPGRGRPKVKYRLTGKGRGQLALSKR